MMHPNLPHVEIPSPLREALIAAKGEAFVANGWAYEALALAAYQQGLISRGKLRGILGMNFDEGDRYLKALDIPYHYNVADLEKDLHTLDRLLGHADGR